MYEWNALGHAGGVEATSEPYGISRDVVEGAAIAGASFTPPPSSAGRDLDNRPVPALSQVTPTLAPDLPSNGLQAPGGRPLADTLDPTTNEITKDQDLREFQHPLEDHLTNTSEAAPSPPA